MLESPELYEALCARSEFPLPPGEGSKNTISGPEITIDFAASTITVQGDPYAFSTLSTVAQELIIAGGAEALVKRSISDSAART